MQSFSSQILSRWWNGRRWLLILTMASSPIFHTRMTEASPLSSPTAVVIDLGAAPDAINDESSAWASALTRASQQVASLGAMRQQDAATMPAIDSAVADGAATTGPSGERLRSWELPAVQVVGEEPATLKENELVGRYQQPRWTTTRRFTSTRVYVVPEGKVETELWARGTFEKDGVDKWRFLQEIEIGLPGRFQLDLYARQDYNTEDRELLWGGQFEVRWALADWGKIWGNPTLYFEYIVLDDRPNIIEPKLLLGGEIVERWNWAANFVGEFEMGGEREYEYSVTGGLSYTLIDSKLSTGIESILRLTDVKGDRGNYTTSLVIGPDIQWKPVPAMTVNIAPLIGVTSDSPHLQLFINVGWEF